MAEDLATNSAKHSSLLKDIETLSTQNEALEDSNMELSQQIGHLTEQVCHCTLMTPGLSIVDCSRHCFAFRQVLAEGTDPLFDSFKRTRHDYGAQGMCNTFIYFKTGRHTGSITLKFNATCDVFAAHLQLETAHKKAALAEAEIREAVAVEMEELLSDMEASYKVREFQIVLPFE